jgi:peptidyl-prolyl cis-trans isomerase D
MISWMQKHKKWLVITIWISTIAFVGAGFVGWGSYNYGKSGGTVATVGELEIDMKDLQKEYSGLYAQYEQMFGGSFNQETAEKLNLQEQAYNNLVQNISS